MKPEMVRLGSLYFNEQPSDVGVAYNCEVLSFGDSAAGKEIQWVKDGSMLIADSCVCTNISWRQLSRMGFVFGALVQVNGEDYLCRCLKVGSEEGEPNEWDALLDKYGEGDHLWNFVEIYFWGQETNLRCQTARALRGYFEGRFWDSCLAEHCDKKIGFRPVLEPITLLQLSESLVGSRITVFGPCGESIRGELISFDNYDLMLVPERKTKFRWAAQKGKQFVVSRDVIAGIIKTQD